MRRSGIQLLLATLTLGLLLAAGCVERKEKIEVRPDGSVAMTLTITADNAQELEAAGLPSAAEGWKLEREALKREGQADRLQVRAMRVFAAGEALPDRDPGAGAGASLAAADVGLRYPTTVTVEKRPDGTYYHFRRVYPARAWQFLAALEERAGHEQIKELAAKEKPSRAERETVLRWYATTEALKKLTLARQAFLAVTPKAGQDHWLAVHQAGIRAAEALDVKPLAQLLEQPDSPQRNQAITAELENLEPQLDKAIGAALQKDAQYSEQQLQAFAVHYARAQALQKATADAAGRKYDVNVVLPGELLSSNSATGQPQWSFVGDVMLDREAELLASSRLVTK